MIESFCLKSPMAATILGIAALLYIDMEVNGMRRPYPFLLAAAPLTCIGLVITGSVVRLMPRPRLFLLMSLACIVATVFDFVAIVHASLRFTLFQACCNPQWNPDNEMNTLACASEITDCSFSIASACLHLLALFLCLHLLVHASLHHLYAAIVHHDLRLAYIRYLDRIRYVT
ncbi:Aste57867_22486 [Aphanomyces stellatus]|uniref:Aste57867_22486 protein n=1 Tax=Aphanomyces stellatus TaxID=120398 RepID=A0A485LK66_9STRA|nr:hypothetical protein As57867_022416 [Aphanomyces stellatus]VFT99146.1 Aste57867_22486 [Aphanomyces stellatus]